MITFTINHECYECLNIVSVVNTTLIIIKKASFVIRLDVLK